MKKYKSIFLSDIHLGSYGCKPTMLLDFISKVEAEQWFLLGDIIDGWKIQQKNWYWDDNCTKVVKKFLKKAYKNHNITYIIGNHDEFLRPLIELGFTIDGIEICNEKIYTSLNNKKYLLTHGDLYDGVIDITWLSFLGDRAYSVLLYINHFLNKFRRTFGLKYWSFSHYMKKQVKLAVNFINNFENNLSELCNIKKTDGIICGHIHTAEIKDINGVIYMNTGDWVESCTALVETLDGKFKIINWKDHYEHTDI